MKYSNCPECLNDSMYDDTRMSYQCPNKDCYVSNFDIDGNVFSQKHSFTSIKPNQVPEPIPAPKRKIVQISNAEKDVIALCDDGTLWQAQWHGNDRASWSRLTDIPQEGASDEL